MLIKGPIVLRPYPAGADRLPGFCAAKRKRRSGWSGWWPWVLSLGIFLLDLGRNCVRQPEAFTRAWWCGIRRPFYGNDSQTAAALFLHSASAAQVRALEHSPDWAGDFFWRRREQLSLRMKPATVWLVCWSVGGLLLMSIIPSKRVDRIFPVVPPFLFVGRGAGRLCVAKPAMGVETPILGCG